MNSVLEPSLSDLLASLNLPAGSTLATGQSPFPTQFMSTSATKISPNTSNTVTGTSPQNSQDVKAAAAALAASNSVPDNGAPRVPMHGASSPLGNSSSLGLTKIINGVNGSMISTMDGDMVLTRNTAARSGKLKQHKDDTSREVHAMNACNAAYSFSDSNRPVDNAAYSALMGAGDQSGPVADTSILHGGAPLVEESTLAGAPSESFAALQAHYDSDDETVADSSNLLPNMPQGNLRCGQMRSKMGDSKTLRTSQSYAQSHPLPVAEMDGEYHPDSDSNSDSEEMSYALPPLNQQVGSGMISQPLRPNSGDVLAPPGGEFLRTEGGRPPRPPSSSSGGLSSHKLTHSMSRPTSSGFTQSQAIAPGRAVHPYVINYDTSAPISGVEAEQQGASTHLKGPMPSVLDAESSAISRSHLRVNWEAGDSDDEDEDEEIDEDEDSSEYDSTELDMDVMSTDAMEHDELRSRVFAAPSSFASESQVTEPGSSTLAYGSVIATRGSRSRHVFQRPVIDGSTLIPAHEMTKYYNCGETGKTEYQHSAVMKALQGAIKDGLVKAEDIDPVHHMLAPIKTNNERLKAAQEELGDIAETFVAQPNSSALTARSANNPLGPSMSLPGSSKWSTPAQTPLTQKDPNTFFSDISTPHNRTQMTPTGTKTSSFGAPSSMESKVSAGTVNTRVKKPPKRPSVFGASSQISPSSALSVRSASRRPAPGTPSSLAFPSSLPDIKEETEAENFSAHGNPFFKAGNTGSATGTSTTASNKDYLARGLCYEPPTSSLASARTLSAAVTQPATWATANEVLAGLRTSGSGMKSTSAMSAHSARSQTLKGSGASKALSVSSSQNGGGTGSPEASSSITNPLAKKSAQSAASQQSQASLLRRKNRTTSSLKTFLRCTGCSAQDPSAMPSMMN